MSARHYAITGCSTGIGARVASILRSQGHQVTGFDLKNPGDGVDVFIPIDLGDPATIVTATTAAADHGPFDGLFNNAGVPPRDGWTKKILQVNFLSQRLFTAAILPQLRNGASILNMASRAGQNWREQIDQIKGLADIKNTADLDQFITNEAIDPTRAYNLSKEAMIVWTLAETESLKSRGLRINALSPAAVSTSILDDFARAFGDQMTKNVARAGRAGEAEEIADVAAFLLSPASRWIYGTDICVDGGMSAFAMSDALELKSMRNL
ncbi:MAG: SDR family oxidoreductase [Burkholderiaceae bacterium]